MILIRIIIAGIIRVFLFLFFGYFVINLIGFVSSLWLPFQCIIIGITCLYARDFIDFLSIDMDCLKRSAGQIDNDI